MGSTVSLALSLFVAFKGLWNSYQNLSERLARDPGLPVPSPSASYWCEPKAELPSCGELPPEADIVIIGSGITGTAVARSLLDGQRKGGSGGVLRIVMLEARDVCSGATRRNGGHMSPNTYQDYDVLSKQFNASVAQDIIRYRLQHLPALLAVAEEEKLLEASQARTVRQFDVYVQPSSFERAKDALGRFVVGLPEREGQHTICNETTAAELNLRAKSAGLISQSAGALHPYRLVTGILGRLLREHDRSFQLFPNTPCTDIALSRDNAHYLVSTPSGSIQARHVVHATNAWASHLLPGMRKKIAPFRAHMSAHHRNTIPSAARPDNGAEFVFYPVDSPIAFDYLSQQRSGELMFGGGAVLDGFSEDAFLSNLGTTDDSTEAEDFLVSSYMCGALGRYFVPDNKNDGQSSGGNIPLGAPRTWTGIIGLSADGQPWIGRVPPRISRRTEPQPDSKSDIAPPGEWIAAGYMGEGMVNAWLVGEALAGMILGEPAAGEGLPAPFAISEKRWKAADIESYFADLS
ncbi:FAD-dependent protein [Mycena kentingensis (nom. inval.)]|nr:FAD-dependent protein [Mycena kentingensis (nom. inval.)]